jgi:hypothetical protein
MKNEQMIYQYNLDFMNHQFKEVEDHLFNVDSKKNAILLSSKEGSKKMEKKDLEELLWMIKPYYHDEYYNLHLEILEKLEAYLEFQQVQEVLFYVEGYINPICTLQLEFDPIDRYENKTFELIIPKSNLLYILKHKTNWYQYKNCFGSFDNEEFCECSSNKNHINFPYDTIYWDDF